ncbi:hypothetical protein Asi03nite_66910 [Actinoplanes siamensis]|uniref:Beta-lactamase class A catalytic domain-containing protein n=1 Tax=Actinoplanes siamensis TaxID=1223317 RepID=A0A919NDZ4_9ACTN|nr:hypothetical protein Asi03nite_66910 [Actinoplanes siamensis]
MLVKGVIGSDGAAATFLTGDSSAQASPSPTGPSPEQLARIARAKKVRALDAALKKYAATVPEFSVAVLDAKTGETYAYRGDEKFETASVVKVQVLACLLLNAQDAGRAVTSSEDSRAKLMIRNSDNNATTSLFNQLGKAAGIQRCDKRLGLAQTTVAGSWGLTRTTVKDQVKLLSQLAAEDSPLSAKSRAYAHTLMSTVAEDQDWGVPAAAKAGEEATVKNGWLSRSTENGLWIINSVGRITGDDVDVSIAVLSHGHKTMPAGITVVQKAATMTRTYLKY